MLLIEITHTEHLTVCFTEDMRAAFAENQTVKEYVDLKQQKVRGDLFIVRGNHLLDSCHRNK